MNLIEFVCEVVLNSQGFYTVEINEAVSKRGGE